MKIAVLLTCFNRCQKTVRALYSLYHSADNYNNEYSDEIDLEVFLTDDGCTDGTTETVKSLFHDKKINIISSDGNSYWAGGMRLAWKAALKSDTDFNYYLLINDDTLLCKDSINELLYVDSYSKNTYNKHCICTGFISDPNNIELITYGAKTYKKNLFQGAIDLKPIGKPQLCTMPNANLLLVHSSVVELIGILDSAFIHGAADWDYGLRASQKGIPVLTTTKVCGYCEFDHDNCDVEKQKVKSMTIRQRKLFLKRPTHFYVDGFTFNYRHFRFKYYLMKIAYYLNVYTPIIYYNIFKIRGH